jgi:hypothetical protein
LKKEYTGGLRMMLKPKLNAKNKITAIGALTVPLLTYSFDIINWRIEEIRKIDRTTTKILTMCKMPSPKGDMDSLYLKRIVGGRDLLQIEATCKAKIINFAKYLKTKYAEDQFVNIVKSCESNNQI